MLQRSCSGTSKSMTIAKHSRVPPDWALLEALASAEDGTEDDVIRATERVGPLAEIFYAIDAAQELERRGRNAADDAAKIGKTDHPVGRRGGFDKSRAISARTSAVDPAASK